MKYLYRTYQLLIALPLIAIYTVITSLIVIIGCSLGNGHFWGYYPGKWWAQFIIRILMLPVKVEGRENLVKGQSYVFVANHQGSFDIFLIYGFLCRNFKWMMKRQLRQRTTDAAGRHVARCIPRGSAHVHRTHGRIQTWRIHARRRHRTARSAAHHQRLVRRHAPHTRHEVGGMASAAPHYPQTDTAYWQGCRQHQVS